MACRAWRRFIASTPMAWMIGCRLHADRSAGVPISRTTRPAPYVATRAAPRVVQRGALDQAFEQLHVDFDAGLDIARRSRQHDEAVRLRHRREYSGTLVARRLHLPAAGAIRRQDATLELGAAGRLANRARERRLERRHRPDVGTALQHEEGVADEFVERHHDGYRIARQPEEMRIADAAVRERPAGLHRDLPEQHLA